MASRSPVRVGDLVTHVASGPSPTCEERNASGEEWGLLKTTAATWSGWNDAAHKVPPVAFWGQEHLEVRQDDVVITKAGPRNRVGVVAHVPATRPRLMVSGKMVLLRPDTRRVVPRFLSDALSTAEAQKYLDDRTTGMAEAQTNFGNATLLATPLLLPKLTEQRRIAEVLNTIDDTINATERMIAKLMIVVDALVDEELARACGEVCPLGRLAQFHNGQSFPTYRWGDSGLPIIRIQNMNGAGDFKYFDGRPEPKWTIRAGDLLFAWSGTRDTSFGPQIWPGPTGVLNQHIFKVIPRTKVILPTYLYLLLRKERLRIADRAHGFKDSFVHVTRNELTGHPVRVPPLSVQKRIIKLYEGGQAGVRAHQRTQQARRRTRAGLADDLLSGRVRVPA